MDTKKIQEELNKINNSSFSKFSDKQLQKFDELSNKYKIKYAGIQPVELSKFNKYQNRKTKLKEEEIISIRSKYNPYIYGKKKLAKEFGISVSLVHQIIHRLRWKNIK